MWEELRGQMGMVLARQQRASWTKCPGVSGGPRPDQDRRATGLEGGVVGKGCCGETRLGDPSPTALLQEALTSAGDSVDL